MNKTEPTEATETERSQKELTEDDLEQVTGGAPDTKAETQHFTVKLTNANIADVKYQPG